MEEEKADESLFGGDGVRARTSTTLREDTARDDGVASDGFAAELEGGDEDLDRGTTSTTFDEEEEEPI